MTPEKGQHVRCFMRSSMVLEGTVENWEAALVVLKSLDGKSMMIVHHPAEDIMLTKVILETEEEIPEEKEAPKEWTDAQQDIRGKLQEVMNPSGDPDLDKMNLDQLRQLVAEQEKQIILQKRREHFGSPGRAKMTNYSSPLIPRSAYKPGTLPSWALGRPPVKGK